MNIKHYFQNKENRLNFTIICSFLITLVFVLFNGFLGLYEHSFWHGSVCFYYLILLSVKAIIIVCEQKIKNNDENQKNITRKKFFLSTSILLFIINLSLIAPITLMVLNQKVVNIGLISAITIAAYTTYKVIISIFNYTKNRKSSNLSYRQIRTINLIDAILSILTLQNTLILVNGGSGSDSMLILSAISSFVGFAIIIFISILSLVKYFNEKNKNNNGI